MVRHWWEWRKWRENRYELGQDEGIGWVVNAQVILLVVVVVLQVDLDEDPRDVARRELKVRCVCLCVRVCGHVRAEMQVAFAV